MEIVICKDITYETDKTVGTWCKVKGEKTLDLNGHKVEYKNSRLEVSNNRETMFELLSGTTMTVKDSTSGKNGKLFCNGYIDLFGTVVIRDVVQVDSGAVLNMESGTITTGRYTTEYDKMLCRTVTKHTWGTGVIVKGGTFNMSGGLVEGSGYIPKHDVLCSAVQSNEKTSVINITGGQLCAYNGAPALYGTTYGKWIVSGGRFITKGTDNTYIEGGGPVSQDAAASGLTAAMIGNWAQIAKGNKSPLLNSTDIEIIGAAKPVIASSTTTASANSYSLKYRSVLPLFVNVAGGKTPYKYSWEILDAEAGIWDVIGTTAQCKYTIGNNDNGRTIRCVVTDANGYTAVTDNIKLSVFYKTEISKIALNIEAPAAGKSPSYSATSATTGVKTGSVVWEKYTTKFEEMKSGEKFEAGKKYRVTIYVNETDYDKYYISPASISERDGYTINGKTITAHTLNQEADRSLIMEFELEAAADPGTTDPGNTDPGQVDPGNKDPEPSDPGQVDPGEEEYVFPFVDVKPTDWFYESVKGAHKMHLIDGMDKTHFEPYSNMTYAQAIKLAACMNQLYKNGKVTLANGTDQWYSTYVDYCLYNGIIGERYSSVINNPIDRQNYAAIFAKALPAKALKAKNTIPDNAIPDVKSDNKYYKEIYTLYRAGICNGSDSKGTFNPNSNIKRSEVAAILIRMMDPSVRVDAPADL